MNNIEICPGPLVHHVRIQALGTQKADATGQMLPLGDEISQFRLKGCNLMLDPLAAGHSKFTVHRMIGKISQHGARRDRDDKSAEDRLLALTGGSRHAGRPTRDNGP